MDVHLFWGQRSQRQTECNIAAAAAYVNDTGFFSASLPRVRLPLGFPRRMYLHSVSTGFFQFCERFSRVFDFWLPV